MNHSHRDRRRPAGSRLRRRGLRCRRDRDHQRRRRPRRGRARRLRLPRGCLTPLPPPATCGGAPAPACHWQGVRDATRFAPSCPQPQNPALTGPTSEDCLYLNVYTSTLDSRDGAGLPVLVWIHGGHFTLGAGGREVFGTDTSRTAAAVGGGRRAASARRGEGAGHWDACAGIAGAPAGRRGRWRG